MLTILDKNDILTKRTFNEIQRDLKGSCRDIIDTGLFRLPLLKGRLFNFLLNLTQRG